jgi:hypothetical protein
LTTISPVRSCETPRPSTTATRHGTLPGFVLDIDASERRVLLAGAKEPERAIAYSAFHVPGSPFAGEKERRDLALTWGGSTTRISSAVAGNAPTSATVKSAHVRSPHRRTVTL